MNDFLALCVCLILILADVSSLNCGQTPIKPSVPSKSGLDGIVGGTVAVPYSWPWQIVLCTKAWFACSMLCGGSVISNQWIMTAGHCVYGQTSSPGKFRVKMGVFQHASDDEPGEVVAEIDQIVLHPQYDSEAHDHDIALLHLASPVSFTDHIQPVCLPTSVNDSSALSVGKSVTVTGWGLTSQGGLFLSSKLRQVAVPMVSQQNCDKDYGKGIDNADMFCAGAKGIDSCQGDSGGPVVQQDPATGAWIQHGIVSWGNGCARAGYPGVYAKVGAFLSFIQDTTGIV